MNQKNEFILKRDTTLTFFLIGFYSQGKISRIFYDQFSKFEELEIVQTGFFSNLFLRLKDWIINFFLRQKSAQNLEINGITTVFFQPRSIEILKY